MNEFDYFEVTQEDLLEIENLEINLLNSSFQLSPNEEDTETEDELQTRRRRVVRVINSDSDCSENIEPDCSDRSEPDPGWGPPKGNQRRLIAFTEISGPSSSVRSMVSKSPADFFLLFVSQDIIELLVSATNNYAIEQITKNPEVTKGARIRQWVPTNSEEMKRFLGLLIYMGLVRVPKLSDYWSSDEITGQQFPKKVMSRNRFEILIRMLHFSTDDDAHKSDRLHRIRKLVDLLNVSFKEHYTASEDICIDESMVPFRGRIIFRQYNKQKRHKYGIKVFKLCSIPGYTHRLMVYGGKNDESITTPTNVVMRLCEDFVDKGHTLYTDNWYTSIDLARKLLHRETHLVGTVRKNRRGLSKKVISTKLKRGHYIAEESRDGITVLKWKDKRDVLVLSTKHSKRFQEITKRGKKVSKPQIVIDYNRAKGAVDLADQLSAYSSPLRKTIRWNKKIALDLLLNVALINSYILYKYVTKKAIKITDFRKAIVQSFCASRHDAQPEPSRPRRVKHVLQKLEGPSRKSRRNCGECYRTNVVNFGRKEARNKTKKVNTYCNGCPEKPKLCHDCFFKLHLYV